MLAVTVNGLEVAVPDGVVRVMLPVVAPAGTSSSPGVVTNVNECAEMPWNRTNVTPVNLEPTSETEVPTGPLLGESRGWWAPCL